MKKILNYIFGIQSGHFYKCPHVRGFDSVEVDPNCHCEKKSYTMTLNIGLTMFALEFLGGILTNSLSLVGDSLHLLADSTAVIMGLVVLWAIARNKKKENDYRKWAVVINGSLLLLASFYLLFESFCKFLQPTCTAGFAMTIIASVGIIGNFLQHHVLISIGGNREKEDLMRTSIVLHIFSDLLQSFAVVAGGICIIFISDKQVGCIFDPMISTGIGFIMTMYAVKLIFKAFQNDEHDHHDHGHDPHHH